MTVTNREGVSDYTGTAGFVTRAWKWKKVIVWSFGIYYNANIANESRYVVQYISGSQNHFDSFLVAHVERFPSSTPGVSHYMVANSSNSEWSGLGLSVVAGTGGYIKNTLINDTVVCLSSV